MDIWKIDIEKLIETIISIKYILKYKESFILQIIQYHM
jgi:hypothetical protein